MNLPNLPPPAIVPLPTMHDLPSDYPEDPGLPDEFHGLQPQLLSETLKLSGYTPMERFNAFDLNLYYDPTHTRWYKRPDWFLVVGTNRLYRGESARSSYVVWDEGIPPIVVVEFLSPGSEAEDLGRFAATAPQPQRHQPPAKFTVYEQILKIPNYIVFDEATAQIRFFRLINHQYQAQAITPTNPRLWIPELAVGLALWSGEYRELRQPWLRWCDQTGYLFPTLAETIVAAQRETETAQREIEVAQREIETAQAAAQTAMAQNRQAMLNLLATGIPPAQVAAAFGLAIDDLPCP
jgi:Uma2 family endonuclease